MTAQDAYEQIRAWFSREDAVFGYELPGGCVYRADGSATSKVRCAAGCLIPDDKYHRHMEGDTVDVSFDVQAAIGISDIETMEFVRDAQGAHDEVANANGEMADFLWNLDKYAEQRGLKVAA